MTSIAASSGQGNARPLTQHEFESEVFTKLKAHYAARLQTLLEACGRDQTPDATTKLRGRIIECKAFLALDKPEREAKEVSDDVF